MSQCPLTANTPMHHPHRWPHGAQKIGARRRVITCMSHDDARMALPLIRDMMLLKQKSKFKFLDQWSLDVRMQHTTNAVKPGTLPSFFIFASPTNGGGCVKTLPLIGSYHPDQAVASSLQSSAGSPLSSKSSEIVELFASGTATVSSRPTKARKLFWRCKNPGDCANQSAAIRDRQRRG